MRRSSLKSPPAEERVSWKDQEAQQQTMEKERADNITQ